MSNRKQHIQRPALKSEKIVSQNSKRQSREQSDIEKAMRGLKEIEADFTMKISTYDDAVEYLKLLFTDGMRLVKYRKQIEAIKSVNGDADHARTIIISNIDNLLEIIINNATKTFTAIKENNNK